jgi:transcription elongation factor GreA
MALNQHIDDGQNTLHEAGRLMPEGLRMLEEELKDLEDVRLAVLADRIRSIRQMAADLSESGDDYQALDEFSQLQAHIAELRLAISSGKLAEEPPVDAGHIRLGSVVTLSIGAHEETYQVVGSVEADALKGRISEESPLGRALLGHAAGDQVRWRSPVGVYRAHITTVG